MNDALAEKIEKDYARGKEREVAFMKLMTKNDFRCYSATSYQDKYEQWDVLIVGDIENDEKSFERLNVKGLKSGVNEGYAWIELQTSDDRRGWLYSEYMNTVAFEMEECFIFVDREKLAQIVNKKIEIEDNRVGEKIIYYVKDALEYYQRYMRRKDITVKAPFNDFEHLISRKLYKGDGRLEIITPKSI